MCCKIEPTMFALGFFCIDEACPADMAIEYLVTVDTNNALCNSEEW